MPQPMTPAPSAEDGWEKLKRWALGGAQAVASQVAPATNTLGARAIAGVRSVLPGGSTYEDEFARYAADKNPNVSVLDNYQIPGEDDLSYLQRWQNSPSQQAMVMEGLGMAAPIYHVTGANRLPQIAAEGLRPGSPPTAGRGGVYADHSNGRTFITDDDGLRFWQGRVENHLFDQMDNPPPTATIELSDAADRRIPWELDEVGAKDTPGGGAWFTDQPIPPADLTVVAPDGTRIQLGTPEAYAELRRRFSPEEASKAPEVPVLYRGSASVEAGPGNWWSTSPNNASDYASGRARGMDAAAPNVTRAQPKPTNPLSVDAKNFGPEDMPLDLDGQGIRDWSAREVADWAESNGYDAVEFRNMPDGLTENGGDGTTWWIKSPPADPLKDLRRQFGGE